MWLDVESVRFKGTSHTSSLPLPMPMAACICGDSTDEASAGSSSPYQAAQQWEAEVLLLLMSEYRGLIDYHATRSLCVVWGGIA